MTGTDSSQTGPRLVAGRYRLTEVLGRGGMGVVWQATDELIGRTVAVKELRVPHGLSERERAAFGERALREARTAGRIRHPGVIAIHDLIPGTAQDDAVYVVMELVEAPSLATVLERDGALPERRVAWLGLRVLEALDAAHAIGLVHRDVKPSNILVLANDQVKLVDFGIAHAVDDTRLTRTGVAGSTGYIAPELFEGQPPTPAADLWSLGVTLHHAATNRSPFERGSTAATIRAVLHDNPPPMDRHPSLAPVIEGLLVRDPNRRMGGREAAEVLRDAIASDRDTAAEPVRQNPRPGEPADRPSAWQNRPTGVHTRPTGTGGPRARANAARRDTDSRAPEHRGPADDAALRRREAQVSNGGRRPATWEDQPTSVRNTAPLSRSMARSGPAGQTSTTATDGDTERCTVFPAKAARQLDNWTFVVLCGLVVWIGWRLLQILGLEGFVPILPLILGALIAASATLTPPWCFSLGAEGISLSRLTRPGRKTVPNSNIAVAWEHIDEVVLVRRRHTSRGSRTAITLHMAATTPADVRSKPPLRSVDRTGGSSGFAWSMGEVNQPVDELNVAFRAATPLHVTITPATEADAEDLRYHGPRRIPSLVASLLLAGILVATYAFHHGGGPVELTKAGWDGELELSPDRATLASSMYDHTIELWDVATRKKTAALVGHTGGISAMQFSPDGSMLAAADDNTIRVWSVSTQTERTTLTVGESTSVGSLDFSPDNHTLASVNDDGVIVVWDVRSGRKTATIRENTSDAFPVEFSSAGLYLSGFDSRNRPHRWEVGTGRQVSAADYGEDWATISGSTVSILNSSGSPKHTLIGHEGKITDLDWAGPAAELLATGSADGTIRIWHTDTGKIARKLTLNSENGPADAVALSWDGKTLVYGSDTTVWIWKTGIGA
ncbi:protein kinase [Streptomyces scopuliridis]|uniref:WD40 repeat domain-containing serine/threonine protein kinase n=1 Tax=Streptomyces scopuliridis TaxID=452529 RepID=UPI003693F0B1